MNEQALARAVTYIKDWLQFQYDNDDVPGYVVAIAHKGKVIFNQAYGYADLQSKQKMTPEHLFRIASHSKTFTATAIMQLQEQGKLRIDDPAAKHLDWLKAHKDPRFANVTIRQLLSHSAGVIRDGPDKNYWRLDKPFPNEEQFKQDILASNLVIDTNTKMKYSNYGFTLLGLIVRSVTGQSYNDYVTKNIVNKLGLQHIGPEYTPKIRDQLVTGYSRAGQDKKRLPINVVDTHAMSPATGFYSDSADLCTYFSAHIIGSGKLLSDESKKEMQHTQWQTENRPNKEEYGLGLDIDYVNNHRLIGHGGGFPGTITKTFCDPRRQLVVTVLANYNGAWSGFMAKSVIKVIDYFQKNYKPKDSQWQNYEGRYASLWEVSDIVSAGGKLVVTSAHDWEPFEGAEELEYVTGDTFKISKCDSFSSFGEPVTFTMKNGAVQSIDYAGGTILPEATYLKAISKLTQIG